MNTWLTTQIGAEAANIVSYVALFIAAIIVLWLIIIIVKRLNKGTYVVGGKNRQPRLSVRDAAPIDSKRQLVLIKRDNIEHLILIGGPTDLVIERNISNSSPQVVATDDIFIAPDVSDIQSNNSQEISPTFPETSVTSSSQVSPIKQSLVKDKEDLAPQNESTEVKTPHKDLTPSQTKNSENDQTIFANLAIHKNNANMSSNTQQTASTKAMSDANYQSSAFEDAAISVAEIKPLVEKINNLTENNAPFEETPRYNTYNQDEARENQSSNNDRTAANEEMKVVNDELTENNLAHIENESLDDSISLSTKSLNQFSSQDELSNGKNTTPIAHMRATKSSPSPIVTKSAKGQESFANTAQLATVDTNIRRDNKEEQLDGLARVAPNSQPKLSPSAQPNTFSSIKRTTSSNSSSSEQNDSRHKDSDDLTRPEQASKQQVTQPDANNPFGKPKPINPYKVMKASGAFRATNNSVNFGTPLANAPVNKSNATVSKTSVTITNHDNAIKQESMSSSKATSSKIDTPDSSGQNIALTNMKPPTHQASATVADQSSSSTNTIQSKDSSSADIPFKKDQMTSAPQVQNNLNASKTTRVNESNSAARFVNPNIDNKSFSDNERLKTATNTNNTQNSPERSIAQRSVPQGMLRPPLMAKPRNIANTAPTNQPVRVDSTAKIEQQAPLVTANIETTNMGFIKETAGLQSVKVIKEDLDHTTTETNSAEINKNSQLAESETANITPDSSSQEIKPSAQNKMNNLQKFSLQLLEPQHILDKPNRGAGNIGDNNVPTDKQIKSREEEEFDKRLQSELNQSN